VSLARVQHATLEPFNDNTATDHWTDHPRSAGLLQQRAYNTLSIPR